MLKFVSRLPAWGKEDEDEDETEDEDEDETEDEDRYNFYPFHQLGMTVGTIIKIIAQLPTLPECVQAGFPFN